VSPTAPPTRHVQTRDGRAVEIRAAAPADAAAMLAYLRRVGAESSHLTFGPEGVELTEEEEREHIARTGRTDNALFLVATLDGQIVGCLTFSGGRRARTRHAGEFSLSVARAHWAQGIGGALVEVLLAWAAAGGVIRKIDLRVRSDNARAIALYERLGFTVEGCVTRALFVDGEFHDTVLMGRLVDPPSP